MRRTIETPGGPLSYELTRKAVKNLNFRLLPGGELAVSAPRRVLPEQVDALVRQKTDWVERARRRRPGRLAVGGKAAADGGSGRAGRVCSWGRDANPDPAARRRPGGEAARAGQGLSGAGGAGGASRVALPDAPAGGAAGGSFSKDDHPMGGGPLGKLRASGGADFHQ